MIKVGIIGADSLIGGELLRVLLLHPEVEIKAVFSADLNGFSLENVHQGLTGDTNLRFSENISLDEIDVLFVIETGRKILFNGPLPEELKVVWIQKNDDFNPDDIFKGLDFVPGVSEMFRKPLVRGAAASRILPPATSVGLIALFPLALHLLLNDSLKIKVNFPQSRMDYADEEKMRGQLEKLLKKVQLSLNSIGEVKIQPTDTIRSLTLEIEFECGISVEEIEKIYNDVYDDHNFTFIVDKEPRPTEVAGTHKCLIHISKPSPEKLRIKAVADSFLRGEAGDAIHAMNLLFGLFEKTGLVLPATLAFSDDLKINI